MCVFDSNMWTADFAGILVRSDCISAEGLDYHPMSVLLWHETICWWGSNPGALSNEEYSFIANNPNPNSDLVLKYMLGFHLYVK